jgi:hypothetical protein
MWVITLKSDGIMCIDFTFEGADHHVLPIFTSPDSAVMFAGGLEHEGERIQLVHIDSMDRVGDLHNLLGHGQIELVVLDPPNLDSEDPKFDMTHWDSDEFVRLLDSLNKISEKYDEKKAISTLDTYLHAILNGEEPDGIDIE